jgi:hypothetical protein
MTISKDIDILRAIIIFCDIKADPKVEKYPMDGVAITSILEQKKQETLHAFLFLAVTNSEVHAVNKTRAVEIEIFTIIDVTNIKIIRSKKLNDCGVKLLKIPIKD